MKIIITLMLLMCLGMTFAQFQGHLYNPHNPHHGTIGSGHFPGGSIGSGPFPGSAPSPSNSGFRSSSGGTNNSPSPATSAPSSSETSDGQITGEKVCPTNIDITGIGQNCLNFGVKKKTYIYACDNQAIRHNAFPIRRSSHFRLHCTIPSTSIYQKIQRFSSPNGEVPPSNPDGVWVRHQSDGSIPCWPDGVLHLLPISQMGAPPVRKDGVTPPPRKCEQTENIITFPHPSDAGCNNSGTV